MPLFCCVIKAFDLPKRFNHLIDLFVSLDEIGCILIGLTFEVKVPHTFRKKHILNDSPPFLNQFSTLK